MKNKNNEGSVSKGDVKCVTMTCCHKEKRSIVRRRKKKEEEGKEETGGRGG